MIKSYDKVKRVILSCLTLEQFQSAETMISLFFKQYPIEEVLLMELCCIFEKKINEHNIDKINTANDFGNLAEQMFKWGHINMVESLINIGNQELDQIKKMK